MPQTGTGRKLFPSAGGWSEAEGYAFCASKEGIFAKVFHAGRDTTFGEDSPLNGRCEKKVPSYFRRGWSPL